MRIADLGEFGLIDLLRRGAPVGESVRVPIGDDAAVVAAPTGRDLLLTCDLLLEGAHFRKEWYAAQPGDLGRKALGVNISDIAAKAGRPLYCLITLGAEDGTDVDFVRGIYDGLYDLAGKWGISVVGGDTVRTEAGLLLDVALIGETTTGHVPLRRDAQPGDLIAVTGQFGLARAGLFVLELASGVPAAAVGASDGASGQMIEVAKQGQLVPPVRLREAWALGRADVHAMSDTSDGLADQVHHICRASGVGAIVEESLVPVHPATRAVAEWAGVPAADWAIWGGEDYELMVTLPPRGLQEASDAVAACGVTALTVVGVVTTEPEVKLKRQDGSVGLLRFGGYEHFAPRDR